MLDASLRMNIVNLFLSLKDQYNVSIVYITHDLSTAYYISDFIAIMYRGNVVEYGPSNKILTDAEHPYTQLLLDSVPAINRKWNQDHKSSNLEIQEYRSMACKFADRCPFAEKICRDEKPPIVDMGESHLVLCYKPVDFQPDSDSVPDANQDIDSLISK